MNELTTIPKEQGMQVSEAAPSPAQMLQAIVKGGITAENVQVFEKAMEIAWRMEERNAVKEFNAAFVKMQSELPIIIATSVIPNRGKYARYEDIMDKDGVGKVLAQNGFSVSFTQDFKDNRIIVEGTLSHVGGHCRKNSYASRSGGKSDSETQSDSKTSTTCKRNCLGQMLNLVIRQDCLNEENDAGLEGDPNKKVTTVQAEELERRAQLTNTKLPVFLRLAGSATFAGIPARNYEMLDRLLREKENQTK